MKNEAKHTSGPWYVSEHDDEAYILNVGEKAPQGITSIRLKNCGMNYDEALANARLIAAAPDLLAALELLYDTREDNTLFPYALRKAAEAINKAKGGAQ